MIPISRSGSIKINNHFKDVFTSLSKRIKYVIKNGARVRGATCNASIVNARFLKRLNTEPFLKRLITASPEDIDKIISIFINFDADIKLKSNNLNQLLTAIFINTEYPKMDNTKFLKRLEIDTCPYCNRNYIYSLSKSSKIKPELDHFYPKSKYPFLGLSFYNLIPSCQTCNGYGAKHEFDPFIEGLKSPYLINDNDFLFTYLLKRLDYLSPLEGNSSVSIRFKKKVAGNNKILKLTKLYNKHGDHILELIVKAKLNYSDDYREYLSSYNGLTFTDTEIDRLLIGNYTSLSELHKRPFSKLYRDIALELGLII
ncbi:HNH endonuclease [Winogradskyella pacifica]|uniref:HNH endonuclease n=1 Tax=Winogradskyella pacifica TaxID=664642 RepID=UPI0015CB9330|nr:hypothetical protein [Winogradskyella pacifica]